MVYTLGLGTHLIPVGLLLLLGIMTIPSVFADSDDPILYSINRFDNSLRVIDPNTASTISTVQMTLDGVDIRGGTSIAFDQVSGKLYGVLKERSTENRFLVTLDTETGVASQIGMLDEKFAEIAFDSSGTLYGVSGDNRRGEDQTNSETLFIIDPSDATSSIVCKLGNGNFGGETIAFNSNDELYHGSGFDLDNVFEKITDISVSPCGTLNIPLSGDNYLEQAALTYWKEQDVFLMVDITNTFLYSLTADGTATKIGDLLHFGSGIAFVTPSLPPLQSKSQVLDALVEEKSGISDKKTAKILDKAIGSLEKSIDSKFWLDDNLLVPKHGKKVFVHEKQAVKQLLKLSDDDFFVMAKQLALIDRQLAQNAIDDASDSTGKKSMKFLEKAQSNFEKGDQKIDEGNLPKAIDHYKKAWNNAQKAMNKVHADDNDDEDDEDDD